MQNSENVEDICGWVLPDGNWHPVKQWWHIAAIYELQELGFEPLQEFHIKGILQRGDEHEIRCILAELGFIKVCRKQVHANKISNEQLRTLQKLFELCDPEEHLELIQKDSYRFNYLKINRFMKLKSSHILMKTLGE